MKSMHILRRFCMPAFLIIVMLLPTAALAVYSTNAPGGDIVVIINNDPTRSDLKVSADRATNNFQKHYDFTYDSGKHWYKSGDLAGTADPCDMGNTNHDFSITVKDASGATLGQVANVFVHCSTEETVKITLTNPQTTGGIIGHLEFVDPRDGTVPIDGTKAHLTLAGPVTLVDNKVNLDANGNLNQSGLPPGTYTLTADYGYVDKAGDPQPVHLQKSGIVVTAGSVTNIGKVEGNEIGNPAAPGFTASSKSGSNCDVGPFSWIFCPIISLANSTISFFKSAVIAILATSPLTPNVAYVMARFITMADVFFVLIFLIIIASTTLSIGLSNYDIKKMLPRFIIAVIAVQFSFILTSLAIDVTNILGAGVNSLILGVLPAATGSGPSTSSLNFAGLTSLAVFGTLTVIVVGPEVVVAVLLIIFSALIGIMVVFVTLMLRTLVIQMLTLLAPLAIAAWVLPNTESYFTKWYKAFTRLLLMYPMIAALFALGTLTSRLPDAIQNAVPGSASAGDRSTVVLLAASIAPILVFFMVPATFKWAGFAMGFIAGKLSSIGSTVNKRLPGRELQKNMKQDRIEKGAMKAMNSNSALGRRVGMMRAGTLIGTASGNRRIAAIASRADKARIDESRRTVRDMGAGDLESTATNHKSESMRSAAIEKLGAMRQDERLRRIRDSLIAKGEGGKMSDKDRAFWTNANASNGSSLADRAPDIMHPEGAKAFDDVSGAQLAGFNKDTAAAYVAHIAKEGQKGNALPALRAAKAIEDIHKSDTLRSRAKGDMGNALLASLNDPANAFSGEVASGLRTKAQAMINSETGRFKRTDEVSSSPALI